MLSLLYLSAFNSAPKVALRDYRLDDVILWFEHPLMASKFVQSKILPVANKVLYDTDFGLLAQILLQALSPALSASWTLSHCSCALKKAYASAFRKLFPFCSFYSGSRSDCFLTIFRSLINVTFSVKPYLITAFKMSNCEHFPFPLSA